VGQVVAEYELIFAVGELADDAMDAVCRAFDATLAGHGCTVLLTVTACGETALAAAQQVAERLEQDHGVAVLRCYEDLVSRGDIAERCGATPQAVGQWVRGERHRGQPFPEPYNHVGGGVWLWGDVNEWLRKVGHAHDEVAFPDKADHVMINYWLAGRAVVPAQVAR
jgi:hypothetical protein